MKRAIAFCLLGAFMLLTGCLQGAPLDSFCYVLDIGMERGDNLPYRFVFLLNQDKEKGDDSQGSVTLIEAEEQSLFDAIESLSGSLPAQLSFERTTLMAFSKELAEAGEISALLDAALGRLKIRHNIRVIIVEEDMPRTLWGLVSEDDPSMNRLKTNVKRYEKNFGYVEDWGLNRMQEAFAHATSDALLPYCGLNDGLPRVDMVGGTAYPYLGGHMLGKGQIETSLCGSAVFSQDRMVGLLSGQHTMMVLMAKGVFEEGHVLFSWQGQQINVALYRVGSPRRSYGNGVFTCKLTVEADLERPLGMEASSQELIDALETYLQQSMLQVFEATTAAGADVFCVGEEAIKTMSTQEAWEQYDFADRIRSVQGVFQVKVKLSHSPVDPALE